MYQKITDYLENNEASYNEGLVLLSQLTRNRILLNFLARKENKPKLIYELRKILKREQPALVLNTAQKEADARQQKIINWQLHSVDDVRDLVLFIKPEEFALLDWNSHVGILAKFTQTDIHEGDSVHVRVKFEAGLKTFKTILTQDPKLELFDTSSLPEIKPVSRVRITRENKELKFEDCSPEMQKLWSFNTNAYHESRSIHEKLKLLNVDSDEIRQPLIDRLIKLSDRIRSNFDVIDSSLEPKDESKPTVQETLNTRSEVKIIDAKRITSNRKYISVNLPKVIADTDNKILFAKVQVRVTELITASQTFSLSLNTKLSDSGFNLEAVR